MRETLYVFDIKTKVIGFSGFLHYLLKNRLFCVAKCWEKSFKIFCGNILFHMQTSQCTVFWVLLGVGAGCWQSRWYTTVMILMTTVLTQTLHFCHITLKHSHFLSQNYGFNGGCIPHVIWIIFVFVEFYWIKCL